MPIYGEFHALQEPQAANRRDHGKPVPQGLKPFVKVSPRCPAAFEQTVVQQGVERGEGAGAGQGIPAERGRMGARTERLSHVVGGETGPDGEPAAQALGQGHDIRPDIVLFIRKEGAGSSHAGLHLVENQQHAAVATERVQLFQKRSLGHHHAPLALYGFKHHRGGTLIHLAFDRGDVVEVGVFEPLRERRESLLHLGLSRCGQGCQGPAMKRVFHGDDLVTVRAVFFNGIFAGELDGGFVGLRPAVAEEHFVGKGMRHQSLGEQHLRFGIIQVRRMQEVPRLSLDGRDQIGMAVTQRIDRDAGDKVQVFPVLGIIDLTPFAPNQTDGEPGIGVHDRPGRTLFQVFSQHCGETSRGERRI